MAGDDEDVAAMQAAFQQFMLSGNNNRNNTNAGASGKKKHKKGKQPQPPTGSSSTPTPATPPSQLLRKQPQVMIQQPQQQHQRSFQEQKIRKKYCQIVNAVRKTLKEGWLDVDDHLGDVIASIVNLRERIHVSSKHLLKNQQEAVASNTKRQAFGYYQNRPQRHHNDQQEQQQQHTDAFVLGHLTRDDVELALSHGLIQHEKMLAGARRLVASLNQAQETLGRRFDELLSFHLEASVLLQQRQPGTEQGIDNDSQNKQQYSAVVFAENVVQWSRQVYTELATELYRKQLLLQTVLDSVHDELLYQDDSDFSDATSPLEIAQNCSREWTRGGSDEEKRMFLSSLLSSTPDESQDSL